MKLSKIYSNNKMFKGVKFNNGLNFVVGKIENIYGENDTHNLGKTKLADLIDFMLLMDGNRELREGKSIFLTEYFGSFRNHIFFLEVLLNNGDYLTIKRGVETNTNISFKLHNEENQNFINEKNWDYENVSLNAKKTKNAKDVLCEILDFNILKNNSIRTYLGYFLRTQYDYANTFKLKNRNDNWKPMLLDLLGFDHEDLCLKYKLNKKITDQRKLIKKEDLSNKFESLDLLEQLIIIKKKEKEEISKQIDNFDFYLKENSINEELVNELEIKISELNKKKYYLTHEISKINTKLKPKDMFSFDLEKTEKIFREVNLNFPNELKKNYKDLIEFNNKITNERQINLENLLSEKDLILESIIKELKGLNNKRIEYLDHIIQKNTFDKFKTYQKEIINKEEEILHLQNKVNLFDKRNKLKEELDELNAEMKKTNKKIIKLTENTADNQLYLDFQLTYNTLVSEIINWNAVIYIKTNRNSNIEFDKKVIDQSQNVTAKGDGYTYGRILTACFDLALLIIHSKKSFIKFIYHDGIFEGLDPRDKNKLYGAIKNICKENNLQYIATALESDLTKQILASESYISKEVILTLTDEEKGKETLMGFEF